MANQPTPNRPWFRLASIRAPPPAPAAAAEPRPPLARPAFRVLAPTTQPSSEVSSQAPPPETTVNVAPSPAARPLQAPPAVEPTAAAPTGRVETVAPPAVRTTRNETSVPSSPVDRVSASIASLSASPAQTAVKPTTSVPTSPSPKPAQVNVTPDQSLTPTKPSDETSPPSPKMKLTASRPPSPLTLPHSQLKLKEKTDSPKLPAEPEPKNVLAQRTIEKVKSSYNNGNGELMRNSSEVRKSEHEASKENEIRDKSTHRKVSVSEDGCARVIILAGENKGAVMELIQSSKKHGSTGTNINRLREKGSPSMKTGGRQQDTYTSSSNEDENVKRKDKNHESETKSKASSPLIAYMNSNVQSVNNSIMNHSKCHQKDPGIHLVLSRKSFSEELVLKEGVTDHHDQPK